jgi:hypothetical protein
MNAIGYVLFRHERSQRDASRWPLVGDPERGTAIVEHHPNASSGGRPSSIDIGQFLRMGVGPEQQALLGLIATLVER